MIYRKYYIYKEQVSYDGGETWKNTGNETPSGDSIGTYRTKVECEGGEVMYRWVNMDIANDYWCEDYSKYYKQKEQVSYDRGETWTDVIPYEYQKGGLYEQDSFDCGYVFTGKVRVWNELGDTTVDCNDNPVLTREEVTGCTDPESIVKVLIGDCVTEIGGNAFWYASFSSITIPNSVTTIGNGAFMNCGYLTGITIPDSVVSIGASAFMFDGKITSVIIPDSVTSIGEYAFAECVGVTSLTLGIGLTSIGNHAFNGCNSLTGDLNIPNSVTTIDPAAFAGCSFTSVTIPNSVTSIGDEAFYGCDFTSVTIPSGLTSINNGVFGGCTSLTSVTIPNSVTTIGESAFTNCTSLTSVTVNATTPPTLGNSAFASNGSGRKIYVPSASVDTYKSASGWSNYASSIQPIP